MALEAGDWERINQAVLRLYREREEVPHGAVMMEVIMEFVPATSVAINRLNLETGGYSAQVAPDGFWLPEQLDAILPHLHESPFPAYHLATGDDRWKMTTDFMPLEDFRATGLYDSMRSGEVEIQMSALLGIFDDTAHAITVNRSSGRFEEREREILDTLHPHFVTSYLNVMSFESLGRSLTRFQCLMEQVPGAYAYLEPDGKVAWMQPRAMGWLDAFFPTGQRTGDGLPMEIVKLATDLGEKSRSGGHLQRLGPASSLLACLARSPMGGGMLRLENRPDDLLPRFQCLRRFSPRVNEVLRWMVEGKRNGEIATILGISPRTVEKHVAVVLEGFGAENRATAIVRAMETYAQEAREE